MWYTVDPTEINDFDQMGRLSQSELVENTMKNGCDFTSQACAMRFGANLLYP